MRDFPFQLSAECHVTLRAGQFAGLGCYGPQSTDILPPQLSHQLRVGTGSEIGIFHAVLKVSTAIQTRKMNHYGYLFEPQETTRSLGFSFTPPARPVGSLGLQYHWSRNRTLVENTVRGLNSPLPNVG
jgi:hypothetical protein